LSIFSLTIININEKAFLFKWDIDLLLMEYKNPEELKVCIVAKSFEKREKVPWFLVGNTPERDPREYLFF